MKKSLIIRLAILVLISSTLSGCIWVPVEDGRGGGYREGGGGEHRGEHHGDRDERH